MYKEVINKIKPEFEKAVSFFDKELAKIRAGRASVSMVEDVIVECFEQKFPLKQLAAISCSEARTIVIHPWDKSYVEPIERALSQSSIGASPIADKDTIRITLPPLSEEYRKDLLKIISEKMEDSKRTIRHWREKAWEDIQNGFKEGTIREDDKFRAKDELQKVVDEYHEKIEKMAEKKKNEIMV